MAIKQFLFLQRKAPLAAGPEAFDLPLTAAAFDQEVRLILVDDGVYWLRAGLPELVLEAVDQIGVERDSLRERGMDDTALPPQVALHERTDVTMMIARSDVVVTG